MGASSNEAYVRLLGLLRDNIERSRPKDPQKFAVLLRVALNIEATIKRNIRSNFTKRPRGALMNSIQHEMTEDGVRVVSAGVPYARIHEFGTLGAGGKLPDIVPKRRKWLTIPTEDEYARVRPRTLRLEFVQDDEGKAWLWDLRKNRVAYRLVKRVKMPPRPYFFPALKERRSDLIDAMRALYALSGGTQA